MQDIKKMWFALIILGIFMICFNLLPNQTPDCPSQFSFYSDFFATRDFTRYKCLDITYIAGVPFCQNLQFDMDKCHILVFSSQQQDTYVFEKAAETSLKCTVHTFDPFFEDLLIEKQREALKAQDSITIKMTDKWRFHRVGLSANSTKNEDKIGWLTSFPEILKLIELEDEPIDLIRMDIDGVEWKFLDSLSMEYACRFVKQLVLVTHPVKDLKTHDSIVALKKLEKCFRLFHRKSRFFDKGVSLTPEKKAPRAPYVEKEVSVFDNELSLVNYLFAYGQLSFVNKNFLSLI